MRILVDEGDQRRVKIEPERSVGSLTALRVCKVSAERTCIDDAVSDAIRRPSELAPRCGEAGDDISYGHQAGIKLHCRQTRLYKGWLTFESWREVHRGEYESQSLPVPRTDVEGMVLKGCREN